MALLERLTGPRDLDRLTADELVALAAEIRAKLITSVANCGGHLGSNLGVVELTIAVHRRFDSPHDTIIWDTGHQSYVHKMLTGRAGEFDQLRRPGGLSGYPRRAESSHDVVENSHASTALSWADGLVKARSLTGRRDRRVVVVVGDGALTGGMAWEALNNIGSAPQRDLVIALNDNGRSYAPTVGGLASHLDALRVGKDGATSVFAALGLGYVGPVDGHDIGALEGALAEARQRGGPVVVHCLTSKGAGFGPAEDDAAERAHAVSPFDASADEPLASPPPTSSWTDAFGRELVAVGAARRDVVAITAAMPGPTGLTPFAQAYPDRFFDVGIAEQHAATSAAGLALGGLHPVVAVYATFLNRCFDQLLLDVALHRAAVTFVLDRAGATGDDGPSHNGMWDLSLLQVVPGLRIAAPRDVQALRELLGEALDVGDAPTVLRFPKGAAPAPVPALDRLGGVDVLRGDGIGDILIVAVGSTCGAAMCAAERLDAAGIRATVVDPRWVKPVPDALRRLAADHRGVLVVEDNGRVGGVGAALAQALEDAELERTVHTVGLPQRFAPHTSRATLLAWAGLTADGVHAAALRLAGAAAAQRSAAPEPPVPAGRHLVTAAKAG